MPTRTHCRFLFMTSASARFALMLAALLWSTNGLIVKLAEASPLALTGIRCATASLLLFGYGRVRGVRFLSFSRSRLVGAFAYFLMAASITAAMKLTTAASAIALQYTAPVFVAVFSVFLLRERLRLRDLALAVLVVIGIALSFRHGGEAQPAAALEGNALALLSGLSYAVFIVASRLQKEETPIASIFFGNLLGLAATLPWVLEMPVSAANVTLGVLYGLFCGGLGFILFSEAICRVNAMPAILIAALDPVLNPLWTYLFLDERPSPDAALGAALVIGAILAGEILNARSADKENRNV